MNKRKIAVLTGTRAEYGLLRSLLETLLHDSEIKLQILVTGMHLSPEFGLTYRQIEKDGFHIDAKIEMLLSADTPSAIAKSIGLGIIGFADALSRLQPDLLVILGDRFEALAAAQVALISRIPIAHIHGGEVTEGAFDESIRHAITKMSSLHFVAAHEFRDRVIQMGEDPQKVYVSGAPGIDNILKIPLYSRLDLEKKLNFSLDGFSFLISYHPETLSKKNDLCTMKPIFDALEKYPEAKKIIIYPNSDTNGRQLIPEIHDYEKKHPGKVLVVTSLDSMTYLSAMKWVNLLVGNSSSFVIEAPSLHTPAVLIGNRQKGRPYASSILHCKCTSIAIGEAIEESMTPTFHEKMKTVQNVYGNGDAVAIISERLKRVNLSKLQTKPFHDIIVKKQGAQ